jgi:hypothetical protein
MGGDFGSMCSSECIVNIDVAQGRNTQRQRWVVLFLALITSAILKENDLPGPDRKRGRPAIGGGNPIRDQPHFAAKEFAQPLGNRCERIFASYFTLDRPAKMGSHHDRSAGIERKSNSWYRSPDPSVIRNGTVVVQRDVQVGADKDPLPGQCLIDETFELHLRGLLEIVR